jgi:leucyl-tRNA synthetase
MHFNTAISQMMIFNNHCIKAGKVAPTTVKIFAQILSPFAPHMGEELWQMTGEKKSLAYSTWPSFNEALTKDDSITMAVQINGKTRTTIEVDAGISKDDFLALIKQDEKVQKYLAEGTLVKEIYVPGKICNLIIK